MEKEINKVPHLSELIGARVWVPQKASTKAQVAEHLLKMICKEVPQLQEAAVAEHLRQREQQMSATLDTGLSIPHVRWEGITQVWAALAVLPQPIAEPNGKLIRAMFLFISPARTEFFQAHLQVLAQAAQVFTPNFLQQLSTVRSGKEAAVLLSAALP